MSNEKKSQSKRKSETPTVLTTLPEAKEVADAEISRGPSHNDTKLHFAFNRSPLSDKTSEKPSKVEEHPYQNLLPVTTVSNGSVSLNVFEVDDVTQVYSHDVFCAPCERNSSAKNGPFSLGSAGSGERRSKSISFIFPNNFDEYEEINMFVETKSPTAVNGNNK